MGLWTLYFAAKIYLYYRGFIRLDVFLNVLFLAFLLLPVPKQAGSARLVSISKAMFSAVFGVLLFWHDTWFPAPLDAYHLLEQNGLPSREYIYSFLLRFYNPKEMLILAAILSACVLVRKYRTATIAGTAVLLLLPLVISSGEAGHRSGGEIEKYLGSFYNSELIRLTHFKPAGDDNPDFDVLILQICSLSWDDLRELNMAGHPFFRQFDYVFTNFNSVSTYSNPSAIRLLNANCGQRRHRELYSDLPRECSLMESLRAQGDAISFVRNHNGKYGNFDDEVKRYGHLEASPFTPAGLVARKYMFDDSPVYDDYAVLGQWWAARQRSGAKRAALYYNTVSLHDGSHWTADKDWWKKDHREMYREFLTALLGDLSKFFQLVSSSGRNTVVIVLGEHGRAVRGSAMETPGLRDIPLPRVTIVPVGIKLFGKGYRDVQSGRNITISKPASYFALSSMLSAFTERSPFQSDIYTSRTFIDSIPQTFYVSENQDNIIVKKDGDYYLFGKDEKWTPLTGKELQ